MKYAIQPGVLLETVCDEHLLIATGEARGKVPYVKNLNETGAWFWQLFEKQLDLAQIEQQAIQTFHISADGFLREAAKRRLSDRSKGVAEANTQTDRGEKT